MDHFPSKRNPQPAPRPHFVGLGLRGGCQALIRFSWAMFA